MATKAQLMAELELLKQQMVSRDIDAGPDTENSETKDDVGDDQPNDPKSYLGTLLESQGIDKDEVDAVWAQLTEELGDLTREKPVLTAAAALGIGFVLGRMSK